MTHEIYVSTDIEADGPIPGPHSMLSFASAAYTEDKQLIGTFSANLETLPGAYETFYALLRDALVSSSKPPVDPADAVATLRVIEAARESAQKHVIVELAQHRENSSGLHS